MVKQQEPYEHRPVKGLPASLLAQEGKTVAVIALMQRDAGLNRRLRRKLESGVKVLKPLINIEMLPSKSNLLSYFLSDNSRFMTFWTIVKKLGEPKGALGAREHALALDIQLLEAYAPDWNELTLDESALAAACPEWPAIRAWVERKVNHFISVKQPPLGLFMLWPRLCDDLGRWDTLDAEHQQIVGRAIFSLSSVSATDWFVREAIGRWPKLKPELGNLLQHPEDALPTQEAAQLSDPTASPAQHQEPVSTWQDAWPGLLDRLDALGKSLREEPNKQAVADLAHLCNEFEAAAVKMPDESSAVLAALGTKIAELVAICRDLQGGAEFEWLDDSLVEQIEARWLNSRHQAIANDSVAALTEEANRAAARSRDAAELYRAAWAQRSAVESQVDASGEGTVTARSIVESRVAARRKVEHQQALMSADVALQDALLTAISPHEAPFDIEVDYRPAAGGVSDGVNDPVAGAAMDHTVATVVGGETITPEPTAALAALPSEGDVGPAALDTSADDVVSLAVLPPVQLAQGPAALEVQIHVEPVEPVEPVAPCMPWSPCGPCIPWSPCGPVSPTSPCGPVSPVGPVSPCGPCIPWSPCGPVGPVDPVAPCMP